MMVKRPLCLYHASCVDGLGAAYAVHLAIPDSEFIAVRYGEPPPKQATNRDILIVDFSYPRDVLEALARANSSVLIIDHHATAQEQLVGLVDQDHPMFPATIQHWFNYGGTIDRGAGNLAAIFDMNRSGAGLTWDILTGNTPRPRIIDLIEDYDLWRFTYGDETRAFNAVVTSYDLGDLPTMLQLLDEWDTLLRHFKNTEYGRNKWADVLNEGRAILRSKDAITASAVRASRRTMRLAGHTVPVACVPGALSSGAGHLLCQGEFATLHADQLGKEGFVPSFSATYYDGADGLRHFSLRSPPGGAHVGNIARNLAARFEADWQNLCVRFHDHREGCFVGGGHEHASGFTAPLGWEGE